MEWLPDQLPETLTVAWELALPGDSLCGIAAADGVVVTGGRDLLDTSDVFVCCDAATGEVRWRYQYPAAPPPDFAEARNGKLDFGNSPRATPAILGNRVITFGAFGDLACLDLQDGHVHWKLNVLVDYGGELPTWGFVGSPCVVGDTLYLQAAATDAALVAIDVETGNELWVAEGHAPAYASLLELQLHGQRQLVGWDSHGAAGWSLNDGQRLWSLPPPQSGEFLVPTPVLLGEHLLLVGEVNGARLHRFDTSGQLIAEPAAVFEQLRPDSHTPVRVGDAVVGVQGRLWSLDAESLQPRGFDDDPELGEYCALISNGLDKTLLLTLAGDLFLHRYEAGRPIQLAKRRLVDSLVSVYAHPALLERRLICRLGDRLVCYELER